MASTQKEDFDREVGRQAAQYSRAEDQFSEEVNIYLYADCRCLIALTTIICL